jgi:hypothetical protein
MFGMLTELIQLMPESPRTPLFDKAQRHFESDNPPSRLTDEFEQEAEAKRTQRAEQFETTRSSQFSEFMVKTIKIYEKMNFSHSQFRDEYSESILAFESKFPKAKIIHLYSFDTKRKLTKQVEKVGAFFQAVVTHLASTGYGVNFAFVMTPKPPSGVVFSALTSTMFALFDCGKIGEDNLRENTIGFMMQNPLALTCHKMNDKHVSLIELFRLSSSDLEKQTYPHGVPPRAELDMDTEEWSRLLAAYGAFCQKLRSNLPTLKELLCVWSGVLYVANCSLRVIVHSEAKGTITDDVYYNIFSCSSRDKIGHITVAVSARLGQTVGVLKPKVFNERYFDMVDLATAERPIDEWEEVMEYCMQPPCGETQSRGEDDHNDEHCELTEDADEGD